MECTTPPPIPTAPTHGPAAGCAGHDPIRALASVQDGADQVGDGEGVGRAHSGAAFSSENGPADHLGDLRDYGVSEPLQSIALHLKGNPIVASYTEETAVQCAPSVSKRVVIDGECRKRALKCAYERLKSLPSLAAGVGHKPEPVAPVGGAKGESGDTIPPRIIPERGQVPENSFKSSNKEGAHVFHDSDARSNFANEPAVLAPKAGTLPIQTAAEDVCNGNVLAGEAAADGIALSDVAGAKRANILKLRHFRPVTTEDMAAPRVDLAERDGLEPAGALKTEREAADAAEKVEKAIGFAHATPTRAHAPAVSGRMVGR